MFKLMGKKVDNGFTLIKCPYLGLLVCMGISLRLYYIMINAKGSYKNIFQ